MPEERSCLSKFQMTSQIANQSFLVTGGAGFIGSHLVAELLKLGAGKVRVLDNFATGSKNNVQPFLDHPAFELIEGDIRNPETCGLACLGVEYVFHQAALGSVPRSISDPIQTHEVNCTGFVNMLLAAKDERVKRFVFASSSSVYGDSKVLPMKEEDVGNLLSPYAVSKYSNELYAQVFSHQFGIQTIGLRYFNVFGPNQDPGGTYAAVIPKFIKAVINNEKIFIDGDGNQSRDFTYVENVVNANLKAMLTENPDAINTIFNIAVGESYSVNYLLELLCKIEGIQIIPEYRESRKGDIRNSMADISKAERLLGYQPTVRFEEGLRRTWEWGRWREGL